MSLGGERKFALQKSLILTVIGIMSCGIAIGYANFYQQVSRYTQSVMYRESQEALKEYNPQLMKRNQRMLSRIRAESSSGTKYS